MFGPGVSDGDASMKYLVRMPSVTSFHAEQAWPACVGAKSNRRARNACAAIIGDIAIANLHHSHSSREFCAWMAWPASARAQEDHRRTRLATRSCRSACVNGLLRCSWEARAQTSQRCAASACPCRQASPSPLTSAPPSMKLVRFYGAHTFLAIQLQHFCRHIAELIVQLTSVVFYCNAWHLVASRRCWTSQCSNASCR